MPALYFRREDGAAVTYGAKRLANVRCVMHFRYLIQGIRIASWMLGLLIGPLFLYGFAAILGTIWTSPLDQMRCARGCDRQIFISLSPVHADLVFPVGSNDPWFEFLGSYGAEIKSLSPRYLAVGWGSRTFYTQTPTWSDVTLKRALKALAFDDAVLHVTPILSEISDGDFAGTIFSVPLNDEEMESLAEAARASFSLDQGRDVRRIDVSYGAFDAFFEATGSYTPLMTCNVWVGDKLRSLGVPMGYWTPFAWSVGYPL